MRTYDDWKTDPGHDAFSDDPDCTCTTHKRDKWCPVHGKDPDAERERVIDDGVIP
jgi:hypothetical protein